MHKMDIGEMRMLRRMCGKTRKDKIRERFLENLGLATIGGKIKETCLRWFGHVQCRPVRKSLAIKVVGPSRERDRPKKTWMMVVKMDMRKCNLSESLAQNRS